ncbi:MAG TPA: hypothetical protein VEL81_05465, partial [Thermoplasmata archaeon]|nr:hypothetical protein [Thermoplasmata archaeon]
TTRYFAEFFGLKSSNREEIRRMMARNAGVAYKEKGDPAEPSPDESAPSAEALPPPAPVPAPQTVASASG